MEGNLRFKIDWASHIVGRKLTVFAMFYFLFEGNFQVQAPGGLIFGGEIQRSVFCVTSLGGLYLEGLIHGGAYFRNFTLPTNLSIRRFWGKGERWKRKNLLSPSPLGRPYTQARYLQQDIINLGHLIKIPRRTISRRFAHRCHRFAGNQYMLVDKKNPLETRVYFRLQFVLSITSGGIQVYKTIR